MMSNEEKINLDLLDSLSEEEKKVALEILKQYSETGTSELFEELQYADFDEVPVDINTFLHDPLYLGKGLTDAEGRFTLYPYWEKCLKDIFPDNITTKYNNIVFTGAIGLGKAQPLDALVLTKDGFKKMGELTLADQVFGNDGNLHKLIGIFPQGTKKMCKVTFTDNTSTVCCEDHLWTVYNTKNKAWTTVSVKQLVDGTRNLNHATGHRYKIPVTKPINFEEKKTVIDPYMLGVLLGDGHVTNNVTFSSNDQEIINNIAQCLDEDYEVRKLVAKMNYSVCKIKNTTCYDKQRKTQVPVPNKYMEAIRQYNLNVTTADKYIPQDYLINSVENRIALLQGLMDTDGYVSKDGSLIEFSTISEKLKDDFVFLIQSLGGTCHVRTKLPNYKDKNGNKKYGKLCYNIGIKLPKTICPFRLSRKANRLSEHALEPYRYIRSIDYVEDQECQCIYIDSQEHLYLTNDFIVTHNSTIAIIAILYMLYRLLCLKDPYLYYGMMPNDKLSISLMNITLENAKGVALDKMNQMILASDWFLQHGEMAGTSNLIYRPEKHIEVVLASSNNQIIGRAIFANFTDECVSADTVIKTDLGELPIKELVGKDFRVLSIDENGNKVYSNNCTAKETKITNEEYQIELEDGTVVKCTGNHLFMLKDGTYKRADELTEDDELFETQETYEEFIGRIIQERGQWNKEIKTNYCERHHIIPKCLGGEPKTLNWLPHDNIIWLTAKEHFIANKLLAYENPNNYDLVCAFKRMCYSNHNNFEVTEDNIDFIKKTWSKLHSQKLLGTKHETHIIKNSVEYSKQKSVQCSGNGNPMFGKGYKVSGGNNGHAVTRYYYNELLFECRKELVKYLHTLDNKISVSTIRKLEQGSARVLREHPIIANVKWEAKHEN